MKTAIADRHNFGQQVKPTDGALASYFQKPRTVFWEWLFFGISSPLRSIFSKPGQNSGIVVSEAFFNLDVSPQSKWTGVSREIISSKIQSELDLDIYARFGMLLGYSYIFGIRDLHRDNLIRTETNLQVIDAEVVLTDLILPHETLLLPFKDVAWKDCGLSHLAQTSESLTERQSQSILAGYIDVIDLIDRNRGQILEVFGALDLSAPIRIILRNTKLYSGYLNSVSQDGMSEKTLLNGEKTQLSRGDIPYFFKSLGANEVRWVAKVESGLPTEFSMIDVKTERSEALTSALCADIARHGVEPRRLLESNLGDEDRLEVRMLRGVMYLRKHLGSIGLFLWRDVRVNVAQDSISFEG